MSLTGHNNWPTKTTYKALYQGMCYLFHHPLVPIMFSNTKVINDDPIKSHFTKWDAELTNFNYASHSGLESCSDADLCRNFLSRRSTTSSEHTFNSVSFVWSITKQPEPGASTNATETRSLLQTTSKTICYRNILTSLNSTPPGSTPTFDENKATIT